MNLTKEQILAKIEAAEAELANLKAELNKPDKFEFKYTLNTSYFISTSCISNEASGSSATYLTHGRYRISSDNAEQAVQLNRESNLIGAIAEQIDPDFASEVVWDGEIRNYYIEYNVNSRQYVLVSTSFFKTPGVVFMTKEVAEQVCEILNSNQVSLKD